MVLTVVPKRLMHKFLAVADSYHGCGCADLTQPSVCATLEASGVWGKGGSILPLSLPLKSIKLALACCLPSHPEGWRCGHRRAHQTQCRSFAVICVPSGPCFRKGLCTVRRSKANVLRGLFPHSGRKPGNGSQEKGMLRGPSRAIHGELKGSHTYEKVLMLQAAAGLALGRSTLSSWLPNNHCLFTATAGCLQGSPNELILHVSRVLKDFCPGLKMGQQPSIWDVFWGGTPLQSSNTTPVRPAAQQALWVPRWRKVTASEVLLNFPYFIHAQTEAPIHLCTRGMVICHQSIQ